MSHCNGKKTWYPRSFLSPLVLFSGTGFLFISKFFVPNFYEIIPEVNTRTKEVVLDYLKQTKMKRWCFMFTALLKKTGLNASCLNPLQKNQSTANTFVGTGHKPQCDNL